MDRHSELKLAIIAALAATLGCSDNEANGLSACEAAGGKCVLGGYADCVTAGSQDCNPGMNPGGSFCCLKDIASTCGNAGVLQIRASDYEQACSVDSDCVAISEGNACEACALGCTNAAINMSDESKYEDDVGAVPKRTVQISCDCPEQYPPCCVDGQCRADAQCESSN